MIERRFYLTGDWKGSKSVNKPRYDPIWTTKAPCALNRELNDNGKKLHCHRYVAKDFGNQENCEPGRRRRRSKPFSRKVRIFFKKDGKARRKETLNCCSCHPSRCHLTAQDHISTCDSVLLGVMNHHTTTDHAIGRIIESKLRIDIRSFN